MEPGRDVAVVRIDRGWGVHHVWHHQHRTYYIRVGSTSREASSQELERLFQERGTFRLELRPVSGTSIRDLDRRRLRDYFEQVREQEAPASTPSDDWRRKAEAWGERSGRAKLEGARRRQGTRVARGSGARMDTASRQHRIPRRERSAVGDRRRPDAGRQQSQPIPAPGRDRRGGLLRAGKGLRRPGKAQVARADRPSAGRGRRPWWSPACRNRPSNSSDGTSKR